MCAWLPRRDTTTPEQLLSAEVDAFGDDQLTPRARRLSRYDGKPVRGMITRARKFRRARRAGDNGHRLCPMCGPTSRRTPWERPDGSAAAARRRRPTTASAPTPERGRGAGTKSVRPTAANAAASLLARRQRLLRRGDEVRAPH